MEAFSPGLAEGAWICRLLAALAEQAGDLRMVVALEREAYALECALHDRRLQMALHAMERAARYALMALDADIERERAWLANHELPAPHEAMDDRQRDAAAIEGRLHSGLAMVPPGREQSTREALLEALRLIREELRATKRERDEDDSE